MFGLKWAPDAAPPMKTSSEMRKKWAMPIMSGGDEKAPGTTHARMMAMWK